MSSVIKQPAAEPQIPEKTWSNPFNEETFLGGLFHDIITEERDVIIIIDDYYGRRGTGKTVASLQIANAMDQTEEGLTWDKCTLQPEKIRNAYANQPPRSGLVMDEAEFGASNRQAMTKTNQALREICSMGRVEQKYLIVNTPIRSFIDTDIQKLADVWISMMRRGRALVHELRWETYSKTLLTPRQQWIEFDDIPKNTPLRGVYNKLTQEKRGYIGGEETDRFVPEDEHNEIIEKVRERQQRETRNEIIEAVVGTPEFKESNMTYGFVADQLGLSEQYVGNIARGERT